MVSSSQQDPVTFTLRGMKARPALGGRPWVSLSLLAFPSIVGA